MEKISHHYHLLRQITQREVLGRYKGSMIGLAWSFLNPLMMLIVYTFVFGVVFKARWQVTGSHEDFALNLFAGLIVFTMFAETINRAPGLILSNVSYVKKVVFPLEILIPSVALSSLFHALVSMAILLLFYVYVHGMPPWEVLWLPLVWLPFMMLILGLSWFLAALGVFLRDIAQVVGVFVTALMFLSPIFYPVKALPTSVQHWVFLNPLALIIEQTRHIVLLGQSPEWLALGTYTVVSALICVGGYLWFVKMHKGFADVI